ncbi:MAG: hypothetical protein K6E34_00740 [Lachnospiraceae bacterium]|nr:hypothetical protein [Lachnospiraceae bacterium]
MGNIESKLRKIFDFQKFEKEPGLDKVIKGVKGNSGIRRLTDDELEYAAAGMGQIDNSVEDDPQQFGRCKRPGCQGYLRKTSDGYICTSCGQLYDKNKNMLKNNFGFMGE